MTRSLFRRFGLTSSVVALSAFVSTSAFADTIQLGVTSTSPKVPVVTENGHGLTPGTYASGTIQLDYTVIGNSFPAGDLATFRVDLNNVASSGGTVGYPTLLSVFQGGSENLTLTPVAPSLPVSGIGWSSSVNVTVSIPVSTANDPALDDDGDVIVGKLQLKADDNKLKTTTTILVRIRLVHPTTTCLRVYDFITDATLANTITTTKVNVNPQGKVTSTNPYGSLSQNVMVVNTCGAAESFDLRIALDSWFSTQPNNNPGNAVFTFSTAGAVDPSSFDIASFGLGTPQGQKMCLANVSVPGDSTYLATVHMSINNGQQASGLPSSGVFSGFGAALTVAGAACGGSAHPGAAPNPVSAPLAFTR